MLDEGHEPDFGIGILGASSNRRIRCPRCGWVPDGRKHWGCEACGAVFDTFATRARCSDCPRSWSFTECPRCEERSPHEDWYVDLGA